MSAQPKPAPQLRVLMVEDSAADAELSLRELRRGGLEVQAEVVRTAQELQQLRAADFDLMLCDYQLCGWNGFEALRMVREQAAGAPPCIVVTGSVGEEAAVECLKHGAADVVLKNRLGRLPVAAERAMREAAAARQQAEAAAALRRAQEQLEVRVQERTRELSTINHALRREVEQRRQAQMALRQSEERFRLMSEASPAFVWTAKADGAIDYSNRRWLEYSGMTLPESLGQGWERALHPEDLPRTLELWKRSLETGEEFEIEYRLRRRDGEFRWHVGRAVAARDEAGKIVKWFGTCIDIHEQKLAQQENLQLSALREDLVANVSHALRTPLASMRGFSELLLERAFSPEKQREFLGVIHKESGRLTELINRFLDLQRMESGKHALRFEALELEHLLRERAAFFATPDARHTLRLDLQVPLPAVLADLERIRDVLNNLISNALKYSPQGGEVVVGARAEREQVVVWVTDSGMGIPAEAMPQLFNKFYRVENPASATISGTGLGLALVKQVMELHGGRAWAESVCGEGSTFFITLPRERRGPALVPAEKSEQKFEPCAPVLLVEDDSAFALLLTEHLGHKGFAVRHTEFAEQALEWCRWSPPKIVLLDLHLAGAMDGWDLLLAMKSDHALQTIPIVVLAGSEPNTHGLALRGADFVSKGQPPEALQHAVLRQFAPFENKRVLIADDDPVFRLRLRRLLEARKNSVTEAANGASALRALREGIPDLLVLDLMMPELDGFELLRRLRNDRRAVNLRILVMTMKELRANEKEYLTRKMASLVGKDEPRLEFLTSTVSQALTGALQQKVGAEVFEYE